MPATRAAPKPAERLTRLRRRLSALVLALLAAALLAGAPAAAQDNNPSGLPLPRFASLRSQPINVRVGPGTDYGIAWVFLKPGLPVEIIQEFDTWRKIRDFDGSEGWVHQSLLVGDRSAYVAPWSDDRQFGLRAGEGAETAVRAWLTSDLLVQVRACDGTNCRVSVRDPAGGPATYAGYFDQSELWGVYPDETFD